MVKKLVFITILVTSMNWIVFGSAAFAINLGYMGTTTPGSCAPSNYLWADGTYHDDQFTSITVGGNGSATLKTYDYEGNLMDEYSYTFTENNWSATKSFAGTDVRALKLCLDSGDEAFFMYGETNNTLSPTVTFDYTEPTFQEDTGGEGEDPPDGGGELDPCDGYLSHLYPQCPDYDGGDSGGDDNSEDNTSDDSGNNGGENSTGGDSGGTSCPVCDLFSCPNWSDYMGKVNEIIAGFPTIEEAIEEQTDRIENDIVGQPPSLPSEPSQPSTVDTYDFENSAPQMKENEELGNSGFTLNDLENEAPEIEFREDPTGGFEILNPVDALPDITTEFPIPGETDAGEWDENKPSDSNVITPEPPTLEPPTISNPPEPSEGNIEPPMPGEGESIEGSYKYKTHPDNPDGV